MTRLLCGRFCVYLCRLALIVNILCLAYLSLRYYINSSASNSPVAVATSERPVGRAVSRASLLDGSNGRGTWGQLQGSPLRFEQPSARKPRTRLDDNLELSSSMTDDDLDEGAKIYVPQLHEKEHVHASRQVFPRQLMPQQPGDHQADSEATLRPSRLPGNEPSLIVTDKRRRDPPVPVMDKQSHQEELHQNKTATLEAEGPAVKQSGEAGSATLPVYILEEHHEALLYWKKVFDAETQRRGSNPVPFSLVHIDAHSDAAPIMPDKQYPFTAKIGSTKNIKRLMTSNDNFIMGSKFAGLVSNGLWIFPDWSIWNETEVNIESHGITKINATLLSCQCPHYKEDRVSIRTDTGNKSDTCFTESRMKPDSRLWLQQKHCYFRKGPFMQISVKQNMVRTEVISAVLARKTLLPAARPDSSTISKLYQPAQKPEDHNDYLLDIDEDFFGVQLAGSQLVRAGIPMTIVWELGESLELIFCPSQTGHEIKADRWFVALLDSVQVHLSACRSDSGKCHADDVPDLVARDNSHTKLLKNAACPRLPAFKRQHLIRTMVPTLAKLTHEQLRVLQSVGICLGVSLSTNLNPLYSLVKTNAIDKKSAKSRASESRDGPSPIVKLCLGHNLPNDSVIQEFVDTRQGLKARLAAMTAILKQLPKPPLAVTICRSSRDGYVPRQQMGYIESGILAALKSVFGQTAVKYDPNLYYGREGWHVYKAKQLGDNFRLPGDEL